MAVTGEWGRITDEGLDVLRRRINVWGDCKPHYTEATRDAFRQFAAGIGDRNPLWQDEEYAKKTRWGGLIAPPTFVYTYARGEGIPILQGLPGVAAFHAGEMLEWFRPIYLGDKVRSKYALHSLVEKPSQHAGCAVDQVTQVISVNQRGEVVADQRPIVKRWERSAVQESVKQESEKWARWHYNEDELTRIERAYETEEVRGAKPRYWEDVGEGDVLRPIVKGPYTATEVVAFYIGAGAPMVYASGVRAAYMRRHPKANVPDLETNVPDTPERIHYETAMAKRWGAPDLFDAGVQRVSWMAHLLVNWMGDDGFLRRLEVRLERPNCYGDTLWISGKVGSKRQTELENLVDIELVCINQRGESSARGMSVISLPSKSRGPVQLPHTPEAAFRVEV